MGECMTSAPIIGLTFSREPYVYIFKGYIKGFAKLWGEGG